MKPSLNTFAITEAGLTSALVDGDDNENNLAGTADADTLNGYAGDDTLAGAAGDDILFGGSGFDIANFSGKATDYRFGWSREGFLTVESRDGIDGFDRLRDIEMLQFADSSFTVSGRATTQVNDGALHNHQQFALVTLTSGEMVASWTASTGKVGIHAQRFGVDGVELGAEFSVNTTTKTAQYDSVMAPLDNGGFVVAWSFSEPNTVYPSVRAQRFDAAGEKVGAEFLVGSKGYLSLAEPAVIGLANGGFVIAWESSYEARANIYNAGGSLIASQLRLDTDYIDNRPSFGGVALADGGFLMTWAKGAADGDDLGVFGRAFDADGTPRGAEFAVNQDGVGKQFGTALAQLEGGDIVVAWVSETYDGARLFFRLFDSSGAPQGDDIRIGSALQTAQYDAAVAGLPGGGFVVIWMGGYYDGIRGQRYDADARPLGDEFRVDFGSGEVTPDLPQVSVQDDGGFAVVWRSDDQLYLRHFDADGHGEIVELQGTPGADLIDLSGAGALAAAGGAGNDVYIVNDAEDRVRELPGEGRDSVQASVSWSLGEHIEHLTLLDAGGTIDGTGNGLNNILTGNRFDNVLDGRGGDDTLRGGAGSDSASYAGAPGAVSADLGASQPAASGGAGNDRLQSIENLIGSAFADWLGGDGGANVLAGGAANDTLRGGTGEDTLDGGEGTGDTAIFSGNAGDYRFSAGVNGELLVQDRNTTDGDDSSDTLCAVEALQFADRLFGAAPGGEFRSSTTDQNESYPAVAVLADGGTVLAWQAMIPGTSTTAVYVLRHDATGASSGEVLRIGENHLESHIEPSVIALADGSFVVVSRGYDVLLQQRFSAAGVALGEELRLNLLLPAIDDVFQAAPLVDGGYVIMRQKYYGSGGAGDIVAQRFEADGELRGGEILVQASGGYVNQWPDISGLAEGGFAVVWHSAGDGSTDRVYLRRFDAEGVAIGAASIVRDGVFDGDQRPAIAQLADGGFVVAWTADMHGQPKGSVGARVFNENGTARSAELALGYTSPGDDSEVQIVALDGGGFAVSWSYYNGSNYELLARCFDAAGKATSDVFRVNTPGKQIYADIVPGAAALADGGFILSWAPALAGGDSDVYWQRFDALGQRVLTRVNGSDQDDQLDISGSGALEAWGGKGNDVFLVNNADDRTIEDRNSGIDTVKTSIGWTLSANVENLVLMESAGSINGTGNERANHLLGNSSANRLDGLGGADILEGQGGNDTLNGGRGSDRLVGGDGSDFIAGNAGVDTLVGGNGADTLLGGGSIDVIAGDAGADSIDGGEGADSLTGGDGNDTILGGIGNDLISGGAHNDRIEGGTGADVIAGDAGADSIDGGEGADSLTGGDGNDTILGGSGNDTILGGSGNDTLVGGIGADRLIGESGNDHLSGWSGADTLLGWEGNDTLLGGSDDDTLTGGNGIDVLDGGPGNDLLNGGDGADIFVFNVALSTGAIDTVADFTPDSDVLRLDDDVFSAFSAGVAVTAAQLHVAAGASSATHAEHRLIYDTTSGALYYDEDGAGGVAAIKFALLLGAPALTADDFVIVG